jgi:hypothetical protein
VKIVNIALGSLGGSWSANVLVTFPTGEETHVKISPGQDARVDAAWRQLERVVREVTAKRVRGWAEAPADD